MTAAGKVVDLAVARTVQASRYPARHPVLDTHQEIVSPPISSKAPYD